MPEMYELAKQAISRCPHCGNLAGLEPSIALRYRCRICGGPRVPMLGEGIQRSHREAPHLKRAKRAHRAQLLYRVLWIISGVVGGFSFLVMLLILLGFSALASGWAALLFFSALPLVMAFWARRRTLQSRAARQEALEEAWTSAAHEVLEASYDELTSDKIAAAMLTDEAHADQLLARLNVDDRVRSRITDDGEVAYSVRAPQRLRVSEAPERTQELTERPFEAPRTTRTKSE